MIYNHIPVTIGCLPKVTAAPIIFQHDQVQILQISGIELPESYRVDFCNPGDARTISMVGTADGVEIPNQLLATGLPVIAYVVLSGIDENAVETRYQITIPVTRRPAASDIQPTPAEQSTIDSLIDAMNDAVEAAETAQGAAETAQGAAEDAQEAAEADALKAEGYALGTQDGTPVSSDSPYYQNNAEYMKDAAASYALAADSYSGEAAAWATGSYSGNPSGVPVPDDAPQHDNNAYYYAQQAAESAGSITGLTAEAETLAPGSSATASFDADTDTLTIGVPTGATGAPGQDGQDGADGVSPEVTIETITGGHSVTITDAEHPAGQTFNVMNGTDGTDGVSPEVTIETITGGHSVTITDADHPTGQTFNVMDGQDGASDAGEVSYDPTDTYDDGTVGKELQDISSDIAALQINKADVILSSASGAIASFPDGMAAPIKSIVANIEPVQSGSGDPSPDNARPISGWTGCKVAGAGKNLLGGEALKNAILSVMPNAEVDSENQTIAFKGATDGTNTKRFATEFFKENTQYTFIYSGSGAKGNLRWIYSDGTYDTSSEVPAFGTPYVSKSGKSVAALAKMNNTATATVISYMESGIFEGVLTADDFVAYQGTTKSITFPDPPETVYGGTITINEDGSGVLTDGMDHATLSNLSWTTKYTGTINKAVTAALPSAAIVTGTPKILSAIAEQYKNCGNKSAIGNFSDPDSLDVGFYCISGASTTNITNLYLVLPVGSSPSGLFVYKKYGAATEYAVSVSPILTLLGQNNIWSTTGDVAVEYRADTKLYIENLTAPTEDNMIADNAIASGKFFMIGNDLYYSTAAIASGATITPGTNATKLSLADALNQINA